MRINLYITAVFFVMLVIITTIQFKTYSNILAINTILQENLLPPLPEWEVQEN